MFASRFESKYLVDRQTESQIKEFIHPFVALDEHVNEGADSGYLISSLYLDSPDHRLMGMTEQGMKNRFKLRIRSYDEIPESPVFLEVKKKIDGVLTKRRVPVRREEAVGFLNGEPLDNLELEAGDRGDAEEFLSLMNRTQAIPVMHVRYMRQAFNAVDGSPLRVTFDRELVFQPAHELEFVVNGQGWRDAHMKQTILEIKFTDRYPSWIKDLIQFFQLQKQSVPKYVISVHEHNRLNQSAWG